MALVLKSSLEVVGHDMKKAVFVPHRDLETVNDKTFVGIDKKDRYLRRMILGSMYTHNTKLLNKTTVLEKINEARYKRVLEVAGFEDDAIESAMQTKKKAQDVIDACEQSPTDHIHRYTSNWGCREYSYGSKVSAVQTKQIGNGSHFHKF